MMIRRVSSIFCALALVLVVSPAALAKEITVRGRLQKTVEAGGWLIATDKEKYLILNAQRFKNEKWFKESTEVEAVGEIKDVMTTFMEGTPFEVRNLRPLAQSGSEVTAGATESRLLSRVVVSGNSIVQAQPDTAILTIAVVTQAKRAIDAQQDNAAKSDAVVSALKAAAGAGAEIKTSGYSLQPQRLYRENQPPTISGYEARNSVTVVLGDLARVGPVIDAAAQAGANDLTGISFTLRKDRPARNQALTEATREAISKAEVIAQALGGRVVRVIEVQEEGFVRPLPVRDFGQEVKLAAVQTPIEVGTLDVTSRVQLIAEVEASR